MKATLLSVGSELLQGFLVDTNVTFLAQELGDLGVEVVGVMQVGDNLERLRLALERALIDSDLVVTTGGIGPTADDLTREAIAAICGEQPTVDPEVLETIREIFTRRGANMPDRNAKQAWTIPSAEILFNPNGTAPGWLVRHGGKVIVSMPGVPREMMPMWRNEAAPRLRHTMPRRSIVAQTLKTIGIGESAVEDELISLIQRGFPAVSTYAKNDGVHIRIYAASDQVEDAERAVAATEAEIRTILGRHVYGYLEDSLPGAVLGPATIDGHTISVWEAGTGGQVAALLLSNDTFANAIREARVTSFQRAIEILGGTGVVDIARKCASAVMEATNANHALGVCIELAPTDDAGRHDARIGIAVATGNEIADAEHKVAAAPPEVRRRATLLAADFLRLTMMDSR